MTIETRPDTGDRATWGLDESLLHQAVQKAAVFEERIGGKHQYFMGIYFGETDYLAKSIEDRTQMRTALLSEAPWHVVAADEDQERLFTVTDHGDVLVPDFQLPFDEAAKDFLLASCEQLGEGSDPWVIWLKFVAHREGAESPATLLATDPSVRDYEQIQRELFYTQVGDI